MSNLINQSGRILITSGPTREHLDPVRFLTNGSSGKMGAALAQASLNAGFEVTVVSGPVAVEYPENVEVVFVTSTEEMLERCVRFFPNCIGVIGAAAPCDYRSKSVATHKLAKQNGKPVTIELVETPDIMATLGKMKTPNQWVVPFALETDENAHRRAVEKLHRKNGDLIVLNGPGTMFSETAQIEIIDRSGQILETRCDTKENVATVIINVIRFFCQ